MIAPDDTGLLAIDTSSSILRLAVRFGDDRLVKSSEEVERAHGQMIMRKVSNLFASSGMQPIDLSGIIVCTGPGSFTGLRVGIAVAKGMAVALDIPVVGVSLFEIAALRLQNSPEEVRVLIFQRKGEYLVARINDGQLDLADVTTMTVPEIVSQAGQNRFASIGPVEPALSEQAGVQLSAIEFDASDFLSVGEPRLASGGDNLDTLEPLYFGKSQAEIRFDQRHKNI